MGLIDFSTFLSTITFFITSLSLMGLPGESDRKEGRPRGADRPL